MAFDEQVAQRVHAELKGRRGLEERRMFGGIAFMLSGNMCAGVVGEELMLRVGPEAHSQALARPHTREMDFTGKPLRGMVFVESAGFRSAADLRSWIALAVAFAGSLPPKAPKAPKHATRSARKAR